MRKRSPADSVDSVFVRDKGLMNPLGFCPGQNADFAGCCPASNSEPMLHRPERDAIYRFPKALLIRKTILVALRFFPNFDRAVVAA